LEELKLQELQVQELQQKIAEDQGKRFIASLFDNTYGLICF